MAQAFCPHCSYPLPAGVASCPACLRPVGASGADKTTKIVVGLVLGAGCLLVGLFVAGIVAAIAIPSFMTAKGRASQKRTMAEMRSIGAALEGFRASAGVYPGGESFAEVAPQLGAHGWAGGTQDGWGHELRWSCWEPDGDGCASYQLVSPGRDGVFDAGDGYTEGPLPANDFDSDLVLNDGMFSRWPESEGRMGTAGS
jgi:type II secretory pathway pseudopilin PulG